MDCSSLDSSVPGIFQARILEWVAFPLPSPVDLPNPGIESASPALAGGASTTEGPRKPFCLHKPPYFAVSGTQFNRFLNLCLLGYSPQFGLNKTLSYFYYRLFIEY